MRGVDAIATALESTRHLLTWFLSDLGDQDLLVRPTEGANHIAWQMGHLIQSERGLIVGQLPQAVYPELPAGFTEQHGRATHDQATGFATKTVYVDLFTQTRQATLAALKQLGDDQLDQPAVGPMAGFAPTLGAIFLLVSNHALMHAGQFSVVRRKLGKPVLF